MFSIVNSVDQWRSCQHISIVSCRNHLDADHKKVDEECNITQVDLVVQVRHYIHVGAVVKSSYSKFIIVNGANGWIGCQMNNMAVSRNLLVNCLKA